MMYDRSDVGPVRILCYRLSGEHLFVDRVGVSLNTEDAVKYRNTV